MATAAAGAAGGAAAAAAAGAPAPAPAGTPWCGLRCAADHALRSGRTRFPAGRCLGWAKGLEALAAAGRLQRTIRRQADRWIGWYVQKHGPGRRPRMQQPGRIGVAILGGSMTCIMSAGSTVLRPGRALLLRGVPSLAEVQAVLLERRLWGGRRRMKRRYLGGTLHSQSWFWVCCPPVACWPRQVWGT
jgi:hypothetical protein